MRQIGNISIADGPDELEDKFVEIFTGICTEAIGARGIFTVCLSGGSTPEALYRRLSAEALAWSSVVFFFGDERCVPSDHVESNFRMADETLLRPLNIAESNIIRWPTELNEPDQIADAYAKRLSQFFGGTPRFDICLLGLGPDGHTASLFPHTKALNETEKIAVSNWVPKLKSSRLTLTPLSLNNSREILFVAAGNDKAAAIESVIHGPYLPDEFPAQLIKPRPGSVQWLIDKHAAEDLTED